MLKDKYTFKMDYQEWAQVCAHLKAPIEHAVITPHQRGKAKRLQLMTLSVIKSVTERLDVKLAVFKPQFKLSIKQHEAMAVLVANDHGYFQYNLHLQNLINTIDKEV